MQKNTNKYYQVVSFYIAAYLLAKGLQLVGINRDNPKQSIFIFLDTPEREQYIQSFNFAQENNPDVLVDVRNMIFAVKKLKEVLYQNKI